MTGFTMNLSIECEQEEDDRWLAEVVGLAGVLAYGKSADDVMAKAETLALRALAEQIEHDESGPQPVNITVAAA